MLTGTSECCGNSLGIERLLTESAYINERSHDRAIGAGARERIGEEGGRRGGRGVKHYVRAGPYISRDRGALICAKGWMRATYMSIRHFP